MYLNIQGLTNNFNELEILINQNKYEIIMLSETHTTNELTDGEIDIDGYKIVKLDSFSNRTGGVAIYINSNWQYEIIQEYVLGVDIWWLAIKCVCESISFIVVTVYRSPNRFSSKRQFCDLIREWIDYLDDISEKIIIVGDFNINWLDEDTYKLEIENIINDNNMVQKISEYTRVTQNSRTIIDFLITNIFGLTYNISKHKKISDHETIEIKIENASTKSKTSELKEIEYYKYNQCETERELKVQKINELNYVEDINERAHRLDIKLNNTLQKFKVKKQIKVDSVNEWFNEHLNYLKIYKIRAYEKACLVNSNENWLDYKNIRNKYKSFINKQKQKHMQNKIKNSNNQKQMWRVIKNDILKVKTSKIEQISFINNEIISENEKMVEKLNTHFILSINELNGSIPKTTYQDFINPVECNFEFEEVNVINLKEICESMNNKKDFKGLNIKFIIDNWWCIGDVLVKLFNASMKTGVFPECWKESIVIPVQKVKNTIKCNELRPINMLPTVEKILEKVVYVQLERYFEENSLIVKEQSGFRKKHTCETALNWTIVDWKESVECKKIVCSLFLDFKRAFETIDRNILVKKLNNYGIKNNELKWFESYLNKRFQKTSLNGGLSTAFEVKHGVPQGSVLGTLLFLIYINDIPNVVKNSSIRLFADDTLLFVSGNDFDDIKNKLIGDMTEISKWLVMNKLKLNTDKTKTMVINSNEVMNLYIDGKSIELVNNIKYLGVIIDNRLKFDKHVEYIAKKIGMKIGFFKRIRRNMSYMSAINVYNTVVKPYFEYCSTILFMANKLSIKRLQTLQNKAMRTIIKCNRLTSIKIMLEALMWLSIQQRIVLNVLLFIHKLKSGNFPEYLTSRVLMVNNAQPYNLRNAEVNIRIGKYRLASSQNSILYKGFKKFNELPIEIKKESNFKIFRRKCITYIKSEAM